MANNKVQLADGTTLIDLTNDTVTPQTLVAPATAHAASGETITGVVNLAYAGTATPQIDSGSGSAGSSNNYSRQDHVHPQPHLFGSMTFEPIELTAGTSSSNAPTLDTLLANKIDGSNHYLGIHINGYVNKLGGVNNLSGFGFLNGSGKYCWVILFSFSNVFFAFRNNTTTFSVFSLDRTERT